MPGLAVPDTDEASEATLGTTAACISRRGWSTKPRALPGTNLEKSMGDFHTLPTELLVNIITHLYRDPASQICFGLTSSYFYWQVFHEIADEKDYRTEGKIYRHPTDLRLQVSICGQYTLYGRTEYGFLLDAWDIGWNDRLKTLLSKERWLWRDLRYCEECAKYKPESAFGEFNEQQEMSMAVEDRQLAGREDCWWLDTICKRCKAKELFRLIGEREEVRETWGNAWEERESFGLKRPEAERTAQDDLWNESETEAGYYETWESIFLKLGI